MDPIRSMDATCNLGSTTHLGFWLAGYMRNEASLLTCGDPSKGRKRCRIPPKYV